MIATKPINVIQLDQEAAALGPPHTGHSVIYNDGSKALTCVGLDDVCASALAAYQTHVARRHIVLTVGAQAGSGAPTPVFIPGSDDTGGAIQFGVGVNATAGAMVSMTFTRPYARPPRVMVTAGNAATAALNLYVPLDQLTESGFMIAAANAPAARLGQTYQFIYVVFPQ